jgi:hypothetical protein
MSAVDERTDRGVDQRNKAAQGSRSRLPKSGGLGPPIYHLESTVAPGFHTKQDVAISSRMKRRYSMHSIIKRVGNPAGIVLREARASWFHRLGVDSSTKLPKSWPSPR